MELMAAVKADESREESREGLLSVYSDRERMKMKVLFFFVVSLLNRISDPLGLAPPSG